MSGEAATTFAKNSVKTVPKPWGYEIIWSHTERYVGKVLHVNRGESLSLQYHEMKDETLYVIAGKVMLELERGEERSSITLGVGEAFHVTPMTIHRIEAIEDTDIVEVSTPEIHDVVRLEDRYGRAGTTEA
ncbi:MAG: cupin domain-containing protein [Acidobacteria bacterium]|nr:cupin domain-containing protein [Acidobacteriota bacterium]